MLIHWYRIAHWLWKHKIPFLPKIIYFFQYFLFNSSVPASCQIGGAQNSAIMEWLSSSMPGLSSERIVPLVPVLQSEGNPDGMKSL